MIFGNPDSAYSFNGTTAQIDVPDDPSLTLGSDPFTIAVWVKFSQLATYHVLGHDEGEGLNNKWIVRTTSEPSGTEFYFMAGDPTQNFYPVSYSGWVAEIGKWYFLVVKRDGNNFMLYIDGSLVAAGYDDIYIPDPNTTLQIGIAECCTHTRHFDGCEPPRVFRRSD